MFTKYIRWLYYFLFFLIPLLISSKTSEIFEFNKMIFVYAVIILVVGLHILNNTFSGQKKHIPRFFILVLVFLITQVLSTIFSIDSHTSLYGYYGRFNGGLLSIIAYILLLYVFTQEFDLNSLQVFLKVSVISSFLVILWGLPGKFGLDLTCLLFTKQWSNSCWTDQFRPAERMFSTLGQPNWLGAYLAIHFFIGLYFLLGKILEEEKLQKSTVLYAIYVCLNFIAVLFTRSRSSLGAVAIGICVVLILLILTNGKSIISKLFRKLYIIALIFVIVIFVFGTGIEKIDRPIKQIVNFKFQISNENPIRNQEQNKKNKVTDSLDIRKVVWKGAIDLGLKYPLLGTGVETFAYSYYFVRPVEQNFTSEWDFIYNKAHNEFLNYFATTGFLGLFSYLIVIGGTYYLFLRLIFNNKDSYSKVIMYICLLASYTTIQITNFFGFSTSTINLWFYIIPGILFIHNSTTSDKSHKAQKTIKSTLIVVGIVILVIISYWNLYRYYSADIAYANANKYLSIDRYQQAFGYLDDALQLKYEHVYEDKLSYVLANLAYLAAEQKEDELAERLISLSDGYNRKTLQKAKFNVLYWKTRAKIYYLFYQISNEKKVLEEAIQALKVAEKISPTDPKIYHSLALFYLELADGSQDSQYNKKALSYVNKALELKPDYVDGIELKKSITDNK